MDQPEPLYDRLWFEAGQVFVPGSPVSELDLFAGRDAQMRRMMEVVSQRGMHGVIFGDRGAGKSSIANIFSSFLAKRGIEAVFPRTNADYTDGYSSLWNKVLREATVEVSKPGFGFGAVDVTEHRRIVDTLPFDMRPDDVRRALSVLSQDRRLIIGIDKFDRIKDKDVTALVADTIKTLSDNAVPVTIFLIGVGDSVDGLLVGHESIERSLIQIPMPRMTPEETRQVVLAGLARLDRMSIEADVLDEMGVLSQGLPYITHMLALHSAQTALHNRRLQITAADLAAGIAKSLDNWQQSIVSDYYEATKSQQPKHLLKEVLLACALAEPDEKGFFTAAGVRDPLQLVTGRSDLDIPNYSRHLKEFCEPRRMSVLTRIGETRRFRFRFTKPLMRPFVLLRGVADGMLTQQAIRDLAA